MMLGVIALAAGCSDASESGKAASDAETAAPIVTLRFECFGPCAASQPPTLPSVAVYPDGMTVTAQFEGGRLSLRRGAARPATVSELQDLAAAAELKGDGVLPEVPLPDDAGIADGSGSTFSFRSGGDIATRSVPHLYEQTDFNREGLRAEYLRLQKALLALPVGEPWDWSREALIVDRLDRPPTATEPEWSGPDFRQELENTVLGQCATVPPLGPLTAEETLHREYRLGDEAWTVVRRPLLVHESECSDIDDFPQGR